MGCSDSVHAIQPDNSFLIDVRSQIATGKVALHKQKITMDNIIMFQRLNTSRIKDLQMTECGLTHEMLDQLLKADLSSLERLSLNNNKLGPIGCRVIAAAPTLKNLKSLELDKNKIKDVGARALASSMFQELEDLSLNDNSLSTEGISTLKAHPSILFLSLNGNSIDDKAVSILKTINPNGITFLGLSRNKLTDEGLAQLITIKGLEALLIDRNEVKATKDEIAVPENLFLFY